MNKVDIKTGDLVNMIIGGRIYEINEANRTTLAKALEEIRQGEIEKTIILETYKVSATTGKKEGIIRLIQDGEVPMNDNGFKKNARKILVQQLIQGKNTMNKNTMDVVYFSKI